MRRPLLVLPPPPGEGGGMDHVVGRRARLTRLSPGFPTLRFNYRGVGGSQGQRGGRPPSCSRTRWRRSSSRATTPKAAPRGRAGVRSARQTRVALRIAQRRSGLWRALALAGPTLVHPHDRDELAVGRAELAIVVLDEDLDPLIRRPGPRPCEPLDGQLCSSLGATRTYQRNLPLVGKRGASWRS